jgi:hypothetical protein
MATYEQSTDVRASSDVLFAYLSDVHNLPKYMEAMTSAEPTQGDKIETTAQVDVDHDGTPEEVKGEAWFHVHDAGKKLEWGSPGPNRYSGQLAVLGDGSVSTVSVSISTEHEEEGLDIEEGLKGTLANIKRLVETG